nr:copper resistance protein B [Novosphingobium sp. CECT 9465]
MMRCFHLFAGVAAFAVLVTGEAQAQSMPGMPGMNTPHVAVPVPKKKATKAPPGANKRRAVARPPARRARAPVAHPAAPAPVDHTGHDMSGMQMSAPSAQTPVVSQSGEHAGHDMSSMPVMAPSSQTNGAAADEMSGMDMSQGSGSAMDHNMADMPGMKDRHSGGTSLSAGEAPAPAPPSDHYADRVYGPAAMVDSRSSLQREHGGTSTSFVSLNIAEYQVRNGKDGYRWDGEAWYGGDVNRLTLKSEGEGEFRGGKAFMETAEIQALYSRAIDPYWNLQAGVRYDFRPDPSRTYATIGIEGVAPYWFETEAAVFLSNKGEVLGRIEGYYDQRITQRLILQPRVEINLSAQDVPETRIGAGITNAEFGLRLRYELKREFAPYIGISYDRRMGRTADFARADGENVSATSFVLGVRTWF